MTGAVAAPARRPPPMRRWQRALIKYLLILPLALVALLAMAAAILDTAIGHRLLADVLAGSEMDDGLRIHVGRIDGSIYGRATLEDITLADPRGPFLKVPATTLDWRPLAWFASGLDIRELTLRRGLLLRLPVLRAADPGAPLLPDFDIRIDRLAFERLTVSRAVLGQERRVDFLGRADIGRHRARLSAQGRLGGGDRLTALLDADRAQGRFALALDYAAPRGGLLAGLTGARDDRTARIDGAGDWAQWRGRLRVTQAGQTLAALDLGNRAGRLDASGPIRSFAFPETARRIMGPVVMARAAATLADRTATGQLALRGSRFELTARGTFDLAHAVLHGGVLDARLGETDLFGPASHTLGTHLQALPGGRLGALTIPFMLTADSFADPRNRLERIALRGTARREGASWRIPLQLGIGRIVTGHGDVDPRLVNGHAQGTLVLTGTRVSGGNLAVSLPGAWARLTVAGDLARGTYALAGPVRARGWPLADLGPADADAAMRLSLGPADAWDLALRVNGRLTRSDNATLARLTGDPPHFDLALSAGRDRPLEIDRGQVSSSLLGLQWTGRRARAGIAAYAGSGHQARYGAFVFDASVASDGPRAILTFADPYPPAGLRDVRLALAPIAGGFAITAGGASGLGPFSGRLGLFLPKDAPPRIDFQDVRLSDTTIAGTLDLPAGGAAGTLVLAGGGVRGTLRLAPASGARAVPGAGGEAVDLALTLRDARFGGARPLTVGEGRIEAHGLVEPAHTTLNGSVAVAGVGMGRLFVGRLSATAALNDGRGRVLATINGRRGSQFDLELNAGIAPGRADIVAGGHFGGQPIAMPRRAVLTYAPGIDGGQWRLAPTELDYAGGRLIAQGAIGPDATSGDLALSDVPLSISDVVFADLGLGGTASGLFHLSQRRGQPPAGDARLMLKGLTRSGLLLTSRPIDIALVARLTDRTFEARALASEAGQPRGRLQARIVDLPTAGTTGERLRAGALSAQMRYGGPADAPFRLLALDHFDLTGPVALAADISGSLAAPVIRGSLASDALRLQSSLTGMDITQIAARGSFTGSQLTLSSLSGRTAGNGLLVGSGVIGFADLDAGHGATLDLRIGARKAQLMARPEMAMTATGPLRILSDGRSGTIAGRLRIDNARWMLGQSAVQTQLPDIPTREINRSADIAPAGASAIPWSFLVDVAPGGRIRVEGMGIESSWSASIQLRGTLDAPAIAGHADLIDGTFDFAGRRFDLDRGHLLFGGTSPPDPRLDIAASASVTGLTATVTVAGTSLRPNISFSSVPALPEEDLLARVLFGDSITTISAPEALELGTALAALHGGGGLDPINKLRRAIGLDRLRIVAADVTIPRQTGIGAGKYLGRRVYAEVISDGRGYSSTSLEFRITRILSLLGSVSTVNRQNVNARISKDY